MKKRKASKQKASKPQSAKAALKRGYIHPSLGNNACIRVAGERIPFGKDMTSSQIGAFIKARLKIVDRKETNA